MRVVLERSNLIRSLGHVHRVVERRNTIPILSNMLLSADGGSLELKATDLDLEVTEARRFLLTAERLPFMENHRKENMIFILWILTAGILST